jgi:hypothetical protein
LKRAGEAGEPVVVSDLVIAETSHALQYHYAVRKMEARAILRRFVESGVVDLDPPASPGALASADGAGLVDRLIHLRYRGLGAVTVTSERRQASLARSGSPPRRMAARLDTADDQGLPRLWTIMS